MMFTECKEYGDLPPDVKIYDNFVPDVMLDMINTRIDSFEWPWFWLEESTYRSKYTDKNAPTWDEGFSTLVMLRSEKEDEDNEMNESFIWRQMFYKTFEPLFLHVEYTLGYKVSRLKRAKVNLNTTAPSVEPFEPHIDIPKYDTVTGLVCLNETDGPTYLYNHICPEHIVGAYEALQWYRDNKDSFECIAAVEPKPGRIIIFDGRRFHSGSRPSKYKKRLNLNINWLKEEPSPDFRIL